MCGTTEDEAAGTKGAQLGFCQGHALNNRWRVFEGEPDVDIVYSRRE